MLTMLTSEADNMTPEIKVTTLINAADYQRSLIARMEKSGRATEHDIYMSRYILQIIEDRIREKGMG